MFDTIRVGGGVTHVHSTTTERRAPTDESVRLLMEMEQAAERRVIERGEIKDNVVNARWSALYDRESPDIVNLYVRFTINGVDVERKIPFCQSRFVKPQEKFQQIHAVVVEEVARTITSEILSNESLVRTIANTP